MIAWNNHFSKESTLEGNSSSMSRFINSILKRKIGPDPTRAGYYSSVSSASGDNRKFEAKESFEKVLMKVHSLNLLKRASNYVIINPRDNSEFTDELQSYLCTMGLFPKRPTYITKSKQKVRTKAELMVANFFTDIGLTSFIYEPIIVFFSRKGKPFFKIADFYLPQLDLIHEHFGYTSNSAYVEGMNKKKSIYDNFNIKWFYTTSMDETNLDRVLTLKLNKLIQN